MPPKFLILEFRNGNVIIRYKMRDTHTVVAWYSLIYIQLVYMCDTTDMCVYVSVFISHNDDHVKITGKTMTETD